MAGEEAQEVNLSLQAAEATVQDVHANDPDALPFELSLHLPARPLLPKNSFELGLPETPAPLKVAVTPQESLNELRITITDSPEGYWLGAFCFRRPASGAKANGAGIQDKIGERVEEWTELSEIFQGVPRNERALYVCHVPSNEAEARGHVQRLRELLSGGQVDPSSIGIDGGLSVHDAIKNEALWIEEQRQTVENAAAASAHSSSKKNAKSTKQTAGQEASSVADGKISSADFTAWKSGRMTNLIPTQVRPERYLPQCLRQMSIAAWSPPPHNLRARGHHMYLHVVTLEGEHLFITSSAQGFYVNRSTANRFDASPKASPDDLRSFSLFDVLCAASPLFLANFSKLFHDPFSQRDYFAVVPISNCIQAHPWLARQHAHTADPLRAQSAYLLTGATSSDTLDGTRDWNDEIQSTRELPRGTLQERLMRDRVLNRIYAEFTIAAARAVPRVANGEVQAMNPMDKRDAQMFIVNNLFISKGVDGVDLYPHMGGDEAAHVAVSKDVQGIRCLNLLDVDGICLLGTVVVDWLGERWVAQSVVPGLFRRRDDIVDDDGNIKPVEPDSKDDTQVIYGGVEGPEVIKDDANFHALFGKAAKQLHLAKHNVQDAEKKPHSLWLSVDSKGLRGADGRRYALDLARLNVVDVNWLERDTDGAVIDSDKDESLTDSSVPAYPHRMTLLRQELLEIYWDSELRNWAQQELARNSAKAAQEGKGDAKKITEGESGESKAEPERLDASQFKLAFNPDAFVEFKVPAAKGEEEGESKGASETVVLVKDESDPDVAAVRSAGIFLRERALPRLVTDVAIGTHTTQDGRSLTRQLHARGINMRYLGYLAQLTLPSQRDRLNQELLERAGPGVEGFLAAFRRVVIQEMVVRASKRILRTLLKQNDDNTTSADVIAHFLNCLLGDRLQASPQPSAGVEGHMTADWIRLSPSSIRTSIEAEVKARFRFKLPAQYFDQQMLRPQVLRELCLRMGLQLQLREYAFSADDSAIEKSVNGAEHVSAGEESPAEQVDRSKSGGTPANKKKKKTSAGQNARKSGQQVTSFYPEDVLNVLPVVKDSTPRSTLADEAFEAGRVSLTRGDRALGLDLMTEGVSFHEQIYGLVHPETARCYSTFAAVLHHYATILAVEHAEKQREAEEGVEVPPPELSEQLSVANALRYQRQAVTVSERTLGLDHPETLSQYVNLAVLERLEGDTDASLRCQRRLLNLLHIVHGEDHPEVINALNSVAHTLQNARDFEQSLKVYVAAHEMALGIYGKDSINTAYFAHELSQAYTLTTDLKKAIEIEKDANRVFEARLGKEDSMTKESTTLLNNLAASAVRIAKMDARQKEMTRLGLTGQTAVRNQGGAAAAGGRLVAGAGPTGMKVQANGVTASATGTAAMRTALPDMSDKSLDELVRYIQGTPNGAANGPASASKASVGGKKGKGGGGGGMKKLGRK